MVVNNKKFIEEKKGFTLLELMISVIILATMMGGIALILNTGKAAWHTTDVNIRLKDNLIRTIDRVSKELRESGSDGLGAMQIAITDGGGVDNTDIVRFSVPIICQSGMDIIDANGDVAFWGAPLTWGCSDSTCMDADDNCNTTDYKFIEYIMDNNNRLLRRVLDGGANIIRTDIFASNITDFQASLSADNNVVTIIVTASLKSKSNRLITSTRSSNIYLRNRG